MQNFQKIIMNNMVLDVMRTGYVYKSIQFLV